MYFRGHSPTLYEFMIHAYHNKKVKDNYFNQRNIFLSNESQPLYASKKNCSLCFCVSGFFMTFRKLDTAPLGSLLVEYLDLEEPRII